MENMQENDALYYLFYISYFTELLYTLLTLYLEMSGPSQYILDTIPSWQILMV